MSLQGWQETLISANIDGTAAASSGATSVIPPAARFTLPANYFQIGKTIRARLTGRMSNTAAATLNWKVNLGTVASPIVAFDGGANALTSAKANVTFNLEILMTCRAIGSATVANCLSVGKLLTESVGVTANVASAQNLPLTSPAVGSGFDSTITNVFDITATWGASIASNTLQVHQFVLESLN